MSHKKATLYLAVLFCVLVVQAGATVTVGQPWTGTLPMPVVNYFGPGPQGYANYTWTSTNATYQGGSVFGYVGGYGLANPVPEPGTLLLLGSGPLDLAGIISP